MPALAAALAALLFGGAAAVLAGSTTAALAAAAVGAAAGVLAASWAAAPRARSMVAGSATAAPGESELHRLLDALPVGILRIGGDGAIRFANRRAAELFRLPATPDLPVGTLRARRLLDLVEAALRHGAAGTEEFQLSRGGEIYLRAHARPLAGGEVVLAIEDRTEAQGAGELHRDFVANASHELKTPLAAVSGIIDTLLGHARDDPEATERFLGILAAQTGRMTRLVEDLLSLNRIELNERLMPQDPQDLAAIVGEAVETLRHAAEEAGVELDYTPPEGRPRVLGDRNELGQLFRNLIENAIKYGGPGTEVRVAGVPAPTPAPAPALADQPGMIGVAVRDTGPGIAREHLPRLTERFYRVSVRRSREKGGTGLGLAIVKHILNRHRGRLEIESRVGEGSCFTVWLPLAGPAERPAAAAGAQDRPAPADGRLRGAARLHS